MKYNVDEDLIKNGKIELLKSKLNELETISKLSDTFHTINAMKEVIKQYNFVKELGPVIDSKDYDSKLSEILKSSGKEYSFY